MNIGIQDAFNLTWMLALVLKGRAKPKVLETYDFERKRIARQLVDFDTKFAKMFSTQKNTDSPNFTRCGRKTEGLPVNAVIVIRKAFL